MPSPGSLHINDNDSNSDDYDDGNAMLTPKNFDEVNGNFLFSPKNFEEIRLHLTSPHHQVCSLSSRAARLSGRVRRRRGVRGQGRGREGGDGQEQEESIEPTARAAA